MAMMKPLQGRSHSSEGTAVKRDATLSRSEVISRGPEARRAAGDGAEKLERTYPPRRASAARMRRALGAYLSGQALDTHVVYDVVLAADEAFINAISHAAAADHLIRVTARVSESEASVEIQDRGGGFTPRRSDPRSVADPRSVPDARRTTGRGIFIMESMMDEVSIRSGPRGTIVRMVRRLA
jgi:serine/threonine-protein kinase RsbW